MSSREIAVEALAIGSAAQPRLKPPLALLAGMTALAPFTLQIIVPCLPAMAAGLAVPYGQAQLALTLYLAGVAGGQMLHGPLSDRFGRRPLLLLGLGLYLAGSVACALAPGLALLLLGRVLQALGACAGLVLCRAIIRDCWAGQDAALRLGQVSTVMAVAPMLSPLLGGVVEAAWGWRAALLACAALGLPLLLGALALPETLRQPVPLPGLRGMAGLYGRVLRQAEFRGCVGITGFSTAVFFAFSAGAPLVVVRGFGAPAASYGAAFSVIALAWAAGALLAGRVLPRLGLPRLLGWGVLTTGLGALLQLLVALWLPGSLLAFFLPMLLVALGNGITQPSAIAAGVGLAPALAGTASGLIGTGQMGIAALATVAVAMLEAGSGLPTALVMLGFALCSHLALPAARRAA